MNPFEAVLENLASTKTRAVIVGGFAVVMHGSNRFTPDINIVLSLEDQNCRKAIDGLLKLGLNSMTTEDPYAFLDPAIRQRLFEPEIREKYFFSFCYPLYPSFSVDFFFQYPLPFDELEKRALLVPFKNHSCLVSSLEDLISMKRTAKRGQDLMDIANLETLALIQKLEAKGPVSLEAVVAEHPPVDPDRVHDLLGFRVLDAQAKLDWLYQMLQVLWG